MKIKPLVLAEIPCDVQSHTERRLAIPRCLPFYSDDHQDTTPYNKPGWIPINDITSLLSNSTELDSLCPRPWQYLTADDLNTEPIRGKMGTYSGGGYVANLGYNSESALDVIDSLEHEDWIDEKTAVILVECTVFEPSTSLFSVMRYLYERYPTGGVFTSSKVKTITMYLPQGSGIYRSLYQVYQILLTLVILTFAMVEIAKAIRGARVYFREFWSWVEITLLSSATAAIVIMLYKEKYMREYVMNVHVNPFDNWSADQIVFWSEIEDYLLSCVMFLITIKSLRLIRFSSHIYQMRMTLRDSFTPLYSFAAVFVVMMLAFASFGYMAFGSTLIEYSSLLQSVSSLLQMLIGGKSSYYQLKVTTESSLGPVFLFVYLITALAILLNVVIAILNESYTTSREQTAKDTDDIDYVELLQYVWLRLKTLASYLHSFQNFFRETSRFGRNRRKYEVNGCGRNALDSERFAPRLASMDSLREIQFPRASLETADEMISEVLINVTRLFVDTVPGNAANSDTNNKSLDIDNEIESSSNYVSDFEINSECDSFLEGDLYNSSTLSLELDEKFQFDQLSLLEVSESTV